MGASGAASSILCDERSHDGGVRLFVVAQTGDDAQTIRVGTVLAHLPFALDANDGNLDADDAAELRSEEFRRCVIDRPGDGTFAFMRAGQILDIPA